MIVGEEYGVPNLCLAGGVALNCVANGKVLEDGAFKNTWVQPAAGDAGGALGAALAQYRLYKEQPRTPVRSTDQMKGSYLGPAFEQHEIEERLKAVDARFETLENSTLNARIVDALTAEKAVGWFQGRMEFGPRALSGRSILGDPRSASMRKP